MSVEPDLEELHRASGLVMYELDMLVACHELLEWTRALQEEKAAFNAYVEAFLLHYRNLWDFLESAPRGDDIVAGHFVSGWKPAKKLPSSQRTALNKRLAHLTYARIAYQDRDEGWITGRMLIDLVEAFQQFVDQVDPQIRSWFDGDYQSIETLEPDYLDRS